MDYLLLVLCLVLLYGSAGTGLNLLVGHCGLLSLAHGALFGLGAYGSAVLCVCMGLPIPISLLVGIGLASSLALMLGVLFQNFRGDVFALLTFGSHLIFLEVSSNWTQVTNGPEGISSIPRLMLPGINAESNWNLLVAASLVFGTSLLLSFLLVSAPPARALLAMRDDVRFAEAVGVDSSRIQRKVFILSGALCGLSGAYYAHFVGYLKPSMVDEMLSVLLLAVVIVGGAGSLAGGIAGAIVVVVTPEITRFIGISGPVASNIKQMVFGALLVILMLWKPSGLFGRFDFKDRT